MCQPVLQKQFYEKTHQRSYSANGVNPMSESLPHFNTIDGRNDPPGPNGSRVCCVNNRKYSLLLFPCARQRALGDLRSGRAFETGCDCILATAHVLAGSNTPVCSCSVSDATCMFVVPVPQFIQYMYCTLYMYNYVC